MNKSLLLIICDFLLISVLALVDFQPAQDVEEPPPEAATEALEAAAETDLVALMRQALEDEARERAQLQLELSERESALRTTESRLEDTEETRQQLEVERRRLLREREALLDERDTVARQRDSLTAQADRTAAELAAAQRQQADLASELQEREQRLRLLQESLRSGQEQLRAAEERVATLEETRVRTEQERQALAVSLEVARAEREILRENLTSAQTQVERAAVERQAAERRAEDLAAGVAELAQESTAIREAFKAAQPLSLNAVYQRYRERRIWVELETQVELLLGTRRESLRLPALLVELQGQPHVLVAAAGTPLAPERIGRMLRLGGRVAAGEASFALEAVHYLAQDPRILIAPLPVEAAAALRAPVTLADDPLRFNEVVVVGREPHAYGELEPRLRGTAAGLYLEADSALFQRMFGGFTPRAGDFVFARDGSLLGVMVEDGLARVLTEDAAEVARLPLGTAFRPSMADRIERDLSGFALP